MELRTTREMRRNEQLSKVMAKKADAPDSSAQAQSARQGVLSDKLSLSRQAVAYIDQQRAQLEQKLEEHRAKQRSKLAEAQGKSKELDMLGEQMKVLELCMKIAASVMKGDKVPAKDLEFLRLNDPDGYRIAMALRRHKDDPEEVDSVLEDEEENRDNSAQGAEGGGEAPSVSAPAAASGGGGASASAG